MTQTFDEETKKIFLQNPKITSFKIEDNLSSFPLETQIQNQIQLIKIIFLKN
jgi:hypothetical protein